MAERRVLITGATGKVGQAFLRRFLADEAWSDATIRALCHNRVVDSSDRIEVVRGSISDRSVVADAVEGVTHVVHLATCKETPDDVMDVAVKGMFWLLEECRVSPSFEQFVLIGGDAGMGHFVYPHP
ncbi:MAG: NAD-dependent epimerase/dehydratase family protein, partial [Gemmatimonadetes bacterium]|nr:NAD-dependent epimerase/dehydratase family protein [Gemmatimonadota bacterium]